MRDFVVDGRMGYRCTWIALFDQSLESLLDHFELDETGRTIDFSETGLNALVTDDCAILIADGSSYASRVADDDACALSEHGRALYFMCNDTTMATSLVEFEHGEEVFRIDVEADDGAKVSGQAPVFSDPASIDYDGVAELAKTLAGFRHDLTPEEAGSDGEITVLRRR